MADEGVTFPFDDAMRLAIAFYCILEPDKRAIVMALAEKYADPSLLASAANDQHSAPLKSKEQLLRPQRLQEDGNAVLKEAEQTRLLSKQQGYADQLRTLYIAVLEDALDHFQ
jgi:hypothetical protein